MAKGAWNKTAALGSGSKTTISPLILASTMRFELTKAKPNGLSCRGPSNIIGVRS